MDNEEFKGAVGKFPTGVTVVSASYDGKLWGFTANSFTSVSLSPPLISFCLNKESGSFEAFSSAPCFAVNILSGKQADIAQQFSHRGLDKFANVEYRLGTFADSPLILGAICSIECKKYEQFKCGDHLIIIGEVMQTTINNKLSPLLYYAKSYLEIK